MRIAVVADIHANEQAWNAVLMDSGSLGADRVLCLGDVVGYGPEPARVLESVHARVRHLVLGNHDAALCGRMDPGLFHDEARAALKWTRSRLNRGAARFFRTLPLTIRGPGFRAAHAGFAAPGAFDYILEPGDAEASWEAVPEPLLFVGHSHVPALFVLGPSGIPRTVEPQDFVVEEGKRYLVNVGSVGLSRDGDPRASYCLLDTAEQAVYWRRVPFDLDAFERAAEESGAPFVRQAFRHADPRLRLPPLRERLDFSPPPEGEEVRGAVEVADMSELRRRVSRWRVAALALLGVLLLGGGAGLARAWWGGTRALVLDRLPPPLPASVVRPGHSPIRFPETATRPGEPLEGWRVILGDRRRQRVFVDEGEEGAVLAVESAAPEAEIRLEGPEVGVGDFRRVSAQVMAWFDEGLSGSAEMTVALTRRLPDGSLERLDRFIAREPTLSRAGGWLQAQRTERLLAHADSVQYVLRLRFSGRMRLKDPLLEFRE